MFQQHQYTKREIEDRYVLSKSSLPIKTWVATAFPKYLFLFGGADKKQVKLKSKAPINTKAASSVNGDEVVKSGQDDTKNDPPAHTRASQIRKEPAPAETPQQKWRKKNTIRLAKYQKEWRKRKKT